MDQTTVEKEAVSGEDSGMDVILSIFDKVSLDVTTESGTVITVQEYNTGTIGKAIPIFKRLKQWHTSRQEGADPSSYLADLALDNYSDMVSLVALGAKKTVAEIEELTAEDTAKLFMATLKANKDLFLRMVRTLVQIVK